MEILTAGEMRAIRVLVDAAAKACREDTIGALLYTGAFKQLGGHTPHVSGEPFHMARDDSYIVEFARKLERYTPNE